MVGTKRETPCVLRSELTQGYVDPIGGHPSIKAYIPEVHASPNCERALPKGTKKPVDKIRDPVWCETCTTDKPERATLRRTADGWTSVKEERNG